MYGSRFIILFFCVSWFLVSCAMPVRPVNYYWGNHTYTAYKVIKNADEESNKNHKEEIENIFKFVDENPNFKVPPGIYAEYALMHLNANNKSEYDKYIILESKHFPESAKFLETFTKLAVKKEADK